MNAVADQAEQAPEPSGAAASASTGWLSRVGVVAGGFTALCCLGVSAAVSLATAARPGHDPLIEPGR